MDQLLSATFQCGHCGRTEELEEGDARLQEGGVVRCTGGPAIATGMGGFTSASLASHWPTIMDRVRRSITVTYGE